jgi:hypothetical protein
VVGELVCLLKPKTIKEVKPNSFRWEESNGAMFKNDGSYRSEKQEKFIKTSLSQDFVKQTLHYLFTVPCNTGLL